jgi:hypothetical protein
MGFYLFLTHLQSFNNRQKPAYTLKIQDLISLV